MGHGLHRLSGVPVFDDALGWLQRHSEVCVSGGEGVHVGEDELLGAVAAVELGLVFALDDGEGVDDVGGVGAVEAVEVEVERVEAGAEVAAGFLVPGEGRAAVAKVAGEGLHVVGGVGEAQYVIPHQIGGGDFAEAAVVGVGGDDGELFDDVPVQVRALGFLPCDEVEAKDAEVGDQAGYLRRVE